MTNLEALAAADPLLGARHLSLVRAVLPDFDAIAMIDAFAQRLADPALASNAEFAADITAEAAAVIAERDPGRPLPEVLAAAAAVTRFALRWNAVAAAARLHENGTERSLTRH